MRPEVPGFELLDPLVEEGGPSEVWRAARPDGRLVALKILRSERRDLQLRFELEGRVLRELGGSHHLIGCLEILPNPPTLVLELADPVSLRGSLYPAGYHHPPTPLPPSVAFRAIAEAAVAVTWLHRHHAIHRDVKPSNLLRAADGSIRLIDLGVVARGQPPRALPAGWIEEAVGTLGYAAPELLRNAATAHPTLDIYGLGATLYETLSGRLPFDLSPGESEASLRARIAGGDAPVPLRERGRFPETWCAVVAKAIAPDATDRYQSVPKFAEDLAALS